MELPGSLDARIREIELERRRLDAEMATAVAAAEHRQVPVVDGHRSNNGASCDADGPDSIDAEWIERLTRLEPARITTLLPA